MNAVLPASVSRLPRDKADTLLLMAACVLVLVPHTLHIPLWTSIVCAAALAWRAWITLTGRRLPPRWLLVPVAAAAMAGVYASQNTLFGRDAGVTMLVLLVAFKMLEMHARRDLFVVILLCYFLMLTNFFYSQSMATALAMVAAVITLLTAQLSFQFTGQSPPLLQRFKYGAILCALALPLMLVLFFLFPRIPGPLWGLPSDARGGRTGLSESMSVDNISQLALSDEIAFRVRFIDPAPPQSALYWRGVVLGNFDGRVWTSVPAYRLAPVRIAFGSQPLRHEVTLEPSSQRWLFALEAPVSAPQIEGNLARLRPDMQLASLQPIHERVRYEVASSLAYEIEKEASPAQLRPWLALPPGYNPKTEAFASELRKDGESDLAIVNRVLSHFRNENFRYTLQPPPTGRNAVDDFLFTTRAGFCEHYAGAFVVLMRAAGIPARVVTGYQGGDLNPVDGIMTVRQADAHAWAEVWLAGRGWVRVDPTAAVAPQRVERNFGGMAERRSLGGLVGLSLDRDSWAARVGYHLAAVGTAWNQWVLNYSQDRQTNLLRSFGFQNTDWRTLILLMMGLGSIVMAVVVLPLLLQRRKLDPADALYQRLCRIMARHGIARLAHEGPRSYAERIGGARLKPETRDSALRFLGLYEQLRYGAQAGAKPTKTMLSTLKSLLSHCR